MEQITAVVDFARTGDRVAVQLSSSFVDAEEAAYARGALFALFASHQIATLGTSETDGPKGRELSAALTGLGVDPAATLRGRLSAVGLELGGPPGPKGRGFEAVLRRPPLQHRVKPYGMGLFLRKLQHYSHASPLALLGHLLETYPTEQPLLVATAELLGSEGERGLISTGNDSVAAFHAVNSVYPELAGPLGVAAE